MIQRRVKKLIEQNFKRDKISLLLGPRQVGKTTLLEMLRQGMASNKVLVLNCDFEQDAHFFDNRSAESLRLSLQNYEMIQIDEAQRVTDIGLTLKKIGDLKLGIPIIVTGSSALQLANGIYDSGVGRVYENQIYPLSLTEMADENGLLQEENLLHQRMIYGLYPEVVVNPSDAETIIRHIASAYLFKDIYTYRGLKKPEILIKLLSALALQVGSEVSYNELANTIGIDKETVETYIGLLEQCYIIFRLPSFSRNLRNELKKGKKIYFWDNGIRNAVIEAFMPLEKRNDQGALWENLMISERLKRNSFEEGSKVHAYFWRTHDQAEIDYIEECNGKIKAFEFKWNEKRKASVPTSFKQSYPDCEYEVITPKNFWNFIK